MSHSLDDFRRILVVDFEFEFGTGGPSEGPPIPTCGCAMELRSGEEYRVWMKDVKIGAKPPWPHDDETLFVSYNAMAEMRCYFSLDWKPPRYVLDLFPEYRQIRNGTLAIDPTTNKQEKTRLIDAVRWCRAHHNDPPVWNPYLCPDLEEEEKKGWQQRALRGGDYTPEEMTGMLTYCMQDVLATRWLLMEMTPRLPRNLLRALYRGRYMTAAAASVMCGFPVDEPLWQLLLTNREAIMRRVIDNHPAYHGINFHEKQYLNWLVNLYKEGKIPHWVFTATGRPAYSDKVLEQYESVEEIRKFRIIQKVTSLLEEPSFEVRKHRHFYSLIPFSTITSRNTTKRAFIQAPACLRGFIQPAPGTSLIYSDYSQQEFYIAGCLAQDPEMLRLYREGDPYLSFGKKIGFIPAGATQKTHRYEREICKQVCLAVIYGMGVSTLARKLNISRHKAEDLLQAHKRQFPMIWEWIQEQVDLAILLKRITTAYGWYMTVTEDTRSTTLQNFCIQGLAADILRVAHIALYEASIRVCGPVHDAFMIETETENASATAVRVREIMEHAGRHVLGPGTILRADVEIISYPDRWLDRGRDGGEVGEMWDRIYGTLQEIA
jgi:hypothetical protein